LLLYVVSIPNGKNTNWSPPLNFRLALRII
jgi:hypothetical protein